MAFWVCDLSEELKKHNLRKHNLFKQMGTGSPPPEYQEVAEFRLEFESLRTALSERHVSKALEHAEAALRLLD
jgi:hypothetical protein